MTLPPSLEAKVHGNAPPEDPGPSCSRTRISMSQVQKRSLQRASRRASTHGYTWYKGQLYLPTDFQANAPRTSPLPKRPQVTASLQPPKCPSSRLQIMHVNVGGIQSDRVKEIAHWATMRSIDIVVLTETRWSFTTEWSLPQWHVCHSGTSQDQADGILVMINRKICKEEQIGLAEVLPGRILHVRIHFARRCFDLLGCYQFADTRTTDRTRQRKRFWEHLTDYVSGLPNRNSALIAGDFNCALPCDGHHVGTQKFTLHGATRTSSLHADSETFQSFLQRYNLNAVNCWDAKDPPTYVNGLFGSKIDHFLMRQADCDSFCKKVIYYPAAGFLPMSGAHHIPMVCSIRKIPYVFTQAAGMQSCSFFQRLQCRHAWQMQDETWDSFQQASDTLFHTFHQNSISKDTLIDDFHQHFMPCFQARFPKQRTPQAAQSQDTTTMLTKWEHRRQLLKPVCCTMAAIMKKGFHWTRFHQLKRSQAAHAKALKKRQLHDLLADAEHAASTHDSFGLHQLINKYSPKQPRKRIRLRTAQGQPASAVDALQMTRTYVQELWKGPSEIEYDKTTPTGVPFSLPELISELEKTPAVKAVARPYLPGVFWKCFAAQTARILYPFLETWWNQAPIFVPPQWKAAWLTFLPKPSRPPTSLPHLRPIALQEPLGKAVLGLVTRTFLREITPFLVGSPQYAYIMCRSALDAIRRVSIHCNAVRTLIANQRRSVHQRMTHSPCYQTCGGLQLFLDVSKAFDMMSRGPLFRYLRGLPICQRTVSLLVQNGTRMHHITSKGVRLFSRFQLEKVCDRAVEQLRYYGLASHRCCLICSLKPWGRPGSLKPSPCLRMTCTVAKSSTIPLN